MSTSNSVFKPAWYTIPAFADAVPASLYHKEMAAEKKAAEQKKRQQKDSEELKNLHVLTRAPLLYRKDMGRIRLRLTADDYYKLYINGRFVTQGPAPAWPEHYYYNEMDITSYLQEGDNVLALHLYYQGLVNRVWNSGDGRFGVAAEISPDCSKPWEPQWRYQISRAYSGGTTGYETQYLENFDSNLWEENWNRPDYDDRQWPAMVMAGWADYRLFLQPTWQLSIYTLPPRKIRIDEIRCQVDFGEELTGALKIKAEGRKGDRIIIRCAEELDETGRPRFELRCNCRYEEVWTLKDGINYLEPYDYKAFRYAELLVDEGVMILGVEALVRHYPMAEENCTLTCSDEHLEKIFALCKNGVRYGTQDGYLDCPTREKGQYLGDAVVTGHAQVWLTGSVEMLRKCIDQFARTKAICPGIMAVAPGSFMQEIADFSLLWSELLLRDYQFTGDRDFLREYYPAARGIVEYFSGYARPDGLLEHVADKWNLVDWPDNLRDDYDFPLTIPVGPGCHNTLNALYVGAVKNLNRIERLLELPLSADYEKLRASYIEAFFSREDGLFIDREGSSHAALHSNVYALYYGLEPAGSTDGIADFILAKGFCCGVMFSYFYLKALARINRYPDVYRMLVNESEHGWVNMLREGATTCFEAWGKEQKWNTSLCHPWASAPVPVVIEDIAGFIPDPDSPEGFRFEPHLPEEIEQFSLRLSFRGKGYRIEKCGGEVFLI